MLRSGPNETNDCHLEIVPVYIGIVNNFFSDHHNSNGISRLGVI